VFVTTHTIIIECAHCRFNMPLSGSEQPLRLRGTVVETGTNTFTPAEITVPRILSTQQLYDADFIKMSIDVPVRTTVGIARAIGQLILSDDTPTAFLNEVDPKVLARMEIETLWVLRESAAGVFTVQKVNTTIITDGEVHSERWRNFFPDDKMWLCVAGVGATTVLGAEVYTLGKLDKASDGDFKALIMSRL